MDGGWFWSLNHWQERPPPPLFFFFSVGRKGKGVGRGRSTQLLTCSALLSPTAVCSRIQFHLPLCLDSVALSQIADTYKFLLRSGEKPPETMFDESVCTKQVTFWDGILCFWPQSSEKNLAFWIAFKSACHKYLQLIYQNKRNKYFLAFALKLAGWLEAIFLETQWCWPNLSVIPYNQVHSFCSSALS